MAIALTVVNDPRHDERCLASTQDTCPRGKQHAEKRLTFRTHAFDMAEKKKKPVVLVSGYHAGSFLRRMNRANVRHRTPFVVCTTKYFWWLAVVSTVLMSLSLSLRCFDLLHSGHVQFFKEASQHGEVHVRIGSDKNIQLLKNHLPMYDENER